MSQLAQTILPVSGHPPTAGLPAPDLEAVRKQMFLDFCAALEVHGIPYVILSGYQGYPDRIDSDIDFMVSEADFQRLPPLFNHPGTVPGARLVQVLQHETSACYYVLASQIGARIAYLHPDSAASYRRKGRLWLRSETVLATRRKAPAGFWIPAAAVEFEYYLVKRIDKQLVEDPHLRALAKLMSEDLPACRSVLARHFQPSIAREIEHAICRSDTEWFNNNRTTLRVALANSIPLEGLPARLRSRLANLRRLIHRVAQPTGLVIAVLGPDGSGKTTVIQHLEKEITPAFRRVHRFHLRPYFGKTGGITSPVTDPHSHPPRGRIASVLKAVLFFVDYWVSWVRLVYPSKIRSTLVIFDRYYHDMLIDPVRYRLPSACWLPRVLSGLVPQPDIWLILDAPAEMLVARKGEITLEAAQELTAKYRALANRLPNAVLVDTGGGLQDTLIAALDAANGCLAERIQRCIKVAR
jgi:thymidylate kinase